MVETVRTKKKWSNSVLFQLSLNIILSVLGQKAKGFPCLFLSVCILYTKKKPEKGTKENNKH